MNSVQSMISLLLWPGAGQEGTHSTLGSSALKIRITQGIPKTQVPRRDAETSEAESCRTEYAQSATMSSRTTTTLCQTTEIPKAWEGSGEMTIRTISKQHTGGVTEKKDQPEWMTDGQSAV
jgi:hypothetical protein